MITEWKVVDSSGKGSGTDTKRTRTDRVLVNTDGPVLDRLTLENYYQFPKYFLAHPQDPAVFFIDYSWRQREGSIQEVTLEWSNQMPDNGKWPGGGNPFEYIVDPRRRPALIRRSTYAVTEQLEQDIIGQRVETTAGEMLPVMQEYHYENFLVTKHIEKPFSIGQAAIKKRNDKIEDIADPFGQLKAAKISIGGYPEGFDSVDFINEDPVKIRGREFPPGTLWATNFQDSEYQIENRLVYYTLTFEIRHKPKGWHRRILNAGYLMNRAIGPTGFTGPLSEAQWDAAVKEQVRIKVGDPPGYPRQPVPLDKKGRPFTNADGQIITSALGGLDPRKLVYRMFFPYQGLDFKQNLPNLDAVGVFQ